MTLQDLWIALVALLDVISGAILAVSFGYLLLPSALGFVVGGIGNLITGLVTPISFQQENIVLSGELSDDQRQRVSMILGAALLTGLLGVFGLPQMIVEGIGQEIFLGMLAGVGLYLTKVGFELAKDDWIIGLPCIVVALIVQFWTDNLVWAVTVSVPLGVIIKLIKDRAGAKSAALEIKVPVYNSWWEGVRAEFQVVKPVVNLPVIVGSLALATLTLGGNIAYHAVNLDISGTSGGYNEVNIISGVADFTIFREMWLDIERSPRPFSEERVA